MFIPLLQCAKLELVTMLSNKQNSVKHRIEHRVVRPGNQRLLLYLSILIMCYDLFHLMLAFWNNSSTEHREIVFNPRDSWSQIVYLVISFLVAAHLAGQFYHKRNKSYLYGPLVTFFPSLFVIVESFILLHYMMVSMKFPNGRHLYFNWENVFLYALSIGRGLAYFHISLLLHDQTLCELEC